MILFFVKVGFVIFDEGEGWFWEIIDFGLYFFCLMDIGGFWCFFKVWAVGWVFCWFVVLLFSLIVRESCNWGWLFWIVVLFLLLLEGVFLIFSFCLIVVFWVVEIWMLYKFEDCIVFGENIWFISVVIWER